MCTQDQSLMKSEFFEQIENWFKENKDQSETQWSDMIATHGNESHFGNMLRNSGHASTVAPNVLHKEIDLPLHWNYNDIDGFYFNTLGSDLSREQFENLKEKFTKLLGKPDEIFTYYDLNEPSWSKGNTTLSLCHIDSHGSGYERIIIKVNKKVLKNGT